MFNIKKGKKVRRNDSVMMETDVQRHERAFRKTIEKSHQDISGNFYFIACKKRFLHNARKFRMRGCK